LSGTGHPRPELNKMILSCVREDDGKVLTFPLISRRNGIRRLWPSACKYTRQWIFLAQT
jgi:hypothetical protein